MMKVKEFVERLLDVAENHVTLYVMGCFGAPMTPTNKARYTKNHSYNKAAARVAMINAASADTYGFDCVCLIKGILWGWNGDPSKTYGGAGYAVNGVPDIGADQMICVCSGVSTDFSGIVPGAAVWLSGHIGIYIGDGLVVECSPKWENGVQITALANLGTKAGYNARKWTKWGKLPYIDYTAEETPEPAKKPEESLRALVREVVLEVLEELNPIYKDLADVPDYWKASAEAMLEAGAINGGTPEEVNPTDLNIRRETFKAAVVALAYHDAREKHSEK